MSTIQQIGATKTLIINGAYLLQYSPEYGYFISNEIRVETVVTMMQARAESCKNYVSNGTIEFVDANGSTTPVKVETADVGDLQMTVQIDNEIVMTDTPKQGRYRFVNRDGNYVKFIHKYGYFIDPNRAFNPNEIVEANTHEEVEKLLNKFCGMQFTDTSGYLQNAEISVTAME